MPWYDEPRQTRGAALRARERWTEQLQGDEDEGLLFEENDEECSVRRSLSEYL